jgi:hypothetical protein
MFLEVGWKWVYTGVVWAFRLNAVVSRSHLSISFFYLRGDEALSLVLYNTVEK